MKTIKFMQWNCNVDLSRKYKNGEQAIELIEVGTKEPIAVASVWVEGLKESEIGIKDYSENEGMLDLLIKEGIIQRPHRHIHSGYVMIPICRLVV